MSKQGLRKEVIAVVLCIVTRIKKDVNNGVLLIYEPYRGVLLASLAEASQSSPGSRAANTFLPATIIKYRGIMSSELEQHLNKLDTLLEEYLNLLDSYQRARQDLSKSLASVCFAHHSM